MGPGGQRSKRVKLTNPAELQHVGVPTCSKSTTPQCEHSHVRDLSCQDHVGYAEEETPSPHQQNNQTGQGWISLYISINQVTPYLIYMIHL